MKTIKLNNGIEMPILGLGVYQITDHKECKNTVLEAINIGYRLIDTASAYNNEEAVGEAIKESGVDRKSLFVTTKLWIDDTGYEKTKKAFELSLKKLQLDYLDLYLIHQPFGDVYGSWKAMEELYKEGKIKAIGVANFFMDRLIDLKLHNEVTPTIDQIECHPFYQRSKEQKFLQENNVQMQSWASFAEGKNDIFKNDTLSKIGEKHNKSVAQVILRSLIQRNIVVIPKSVKKERLKENFNVFDFELSSEDMQSIAKLDKNESLFFDHRDPEMVKWITNFKK